MKTNKTNTELLCLAFGWQGGTVHQVAQETGLTVAQIVDTDREAREINGQWIQGSPDYDKGWFAIRTCGAKHNAEKVFPRYKGNLAFWMGAAAGRDLEFILEEQKKN